MSDTSTTKNTGAPAKPKEPGWRLWMRNWRLPGPPDAAPGGDKGTLDGTPLFGPHPAPMLISPTDVDLLARLVRAEAEGEPYEGQVAIAAVVLNRLKSPLFPSTVRGVIYESRQFEPVSNGRINRPAGEDHVRAAHDALSGVDPTGGALFFFNPRGTRDSFMHGLPASVRIGGHVFSRHLA
jgi:spore germination cell wall hydrolase CwlJ-like protein